MFPLWHPSWVTYWLPSLISWKMGCSCPVQVPSLDVSFSYAVFGPPNLEPLWDTAEQFRSTLGTECFQPLQKALSSVWFTLKMYSSTKEVRHKYVTHVSLPWLLWYMTRELYLESYIKMQFLHWTFSVLRSCCCPASVLFLSKQDLFVVCNFSVLLTQVQGAYRIKYSIADKCSTGKFNYLIPL